MISSFGFTATDNNTASNTAESFNLLAWLSSPSSASTAAYNVSGGDSNFRNTHLVVGGADASITSLTTTRLFNKISWSTSGALAAARSLGALNNMLDAYFYFSGGSSNASYTGAVNTNYKYNGTVWQAVTNLSSGRAYMCGMEFGGLVTTFCGETSAGTPVTTVEQFNSSDTSSSGTALPTASTAQMASKYTRGLGILWNLGIAGATASYSYNGSAYSASITAPTTRVGDNGCASGSYTVSGLAVVNGGRNGSNALNATDTYNGAGMAASTASNLNKAASAGSVS